MRPVYEMLRTTILADSLGWGELAGLFTRLAGLPVATGRLHLHACGMPRPVPRSRMVLKELVVDGASMQGYATSLRETRSSRQPVPYFHHCIYTRMAMAQAQPRAVVE
jgi:hypothetical protein